MKKIVHSLYLKYDQASGSLAQAAISQLVQKTMFSDNQGLSSDEIKRNVDRAISSSVSQDRIDATLHELEQGGVVNKKGELYSLRQKRIDEITAAISERNRRVDGIYQKYFLSADYEKDKVITWFDDMCTEFFGAYCDAWLQDISGHGTKQRGDYLSDTTLLRNPKLFRKYEIRYEHIEHFVDSFVRFIKSYDLDDNAVMWDYANSLFASRVLSANIFADRNITDILGESIVLLDTNVLMGLDLEKDAFSAAYLGLAEAFRLLSIRPAIFGITKDEYKNAISHKIDLMKSMIRAYGFELAGQIDDVFMRTAVHRCCADEESFDQFFKSISELPEHFGDRLEIETIEHQDIIDAISKGQKDKKIIEQMNAIYKERHKQRDKHTNSLEHDAGMIAGARYLRATEKAWILTRDGTLNTYARLFPEMDSKPLSISLETLVNLLAISDGGVSSDSTNYSAIFANIIRNKVFPTNGVFQIEDLNRMYEVESQISEMPDSEIRSLAHEVNKMRMQGEKEGKIALAIQRGIQRYRLGLHDEVREIRDRNSYAERRLGEKTTEAESLRNVLFGKEREELVSRYKRERRNSIILLTGLAVVILIGLTLLAKKSFFPDSAIVGPENIAALLVNLVSTAIWEFSFVIPRAQSRYTEKMRTVDQTAREIVEDVVSRE